MSTPDLPWLIYDADRNVLAATGAATHAAVLVSLPDLGAGCTIERDGCVVWREGEESFPAGTDPEVAMGIMFVRLQAHTAGCLAPR